MWIWWIWGYFSVHLQQVACASQLLLWFSYKYFKSQLSAHKHWPWMLRFTSSIASGQNTCAGVILIWELWLGWPFPLGYLKMPEETGERRWLYPFRDTTRTTFRFLPRRQELLWNRSIEHFGPAVKVILILILYVGIGLCRSQNIFTTIIPLLKYP